MLAVLQIAAFAIAIVVGIMAVFAILEIRQMYAQQQQQLTRTIAAIEEFPKLHREFILFLRRIEADSHELQKIALQIEASSAAVDERISASTTASAERQIATVDSLRDYLEAQEQRLAAIVETVSGSLQSLLQKREPAVEERTDSAGHSRYRREALGGNPELRFAVLKDWLAINALAIQHRASRPWKTAADLTANIPAYLQPESEILDGCILLIGTNQHADRLAIPFRDLDVASQYRQWFDPALKGQSASCAPAVLMRSNGHFRLVSKGTHSSSFTN
jgi:hypothetical protein